MAEFKVRYYAEAEKLKVALVVPEDKIGLNCACAPLNIGHLASYLRKYASFPVDVRIIDGLAKQNVHAEIASFQPDLIGVTATTPQAPAAYALLDDLRSCYPDVFTVMGGVHAGLMPDEAIEHADCVVIGEGEKALLDIAETLHKGGTPERIIYGEPVEPLDDVPSPAFDLIDFKPYMNTTLALKLELPCISIVTSRGCPHRCPFCHNATRTMKPRYFSAQRVVDDITYLYEKYHVRSIHFNDDEFVVNKKRLRELAVLFEQTGLNRKIVWGCMARVNSLDAETLKLMRNMGCVVIITGFESVNPRILKYLKCGTVTVQQNARSLPLAHNAGILMGGSIIFGTPTETLEEMKQSLKWFEQQDHLKFVGFNTLIPYPETPLWKMAKRRGLLPEKVDYTKLAFPLFLNENYLIDKAVDWKHYIRFFWDVSRTTWVMCQVRQSPHAKTFLRIMKTPSFWKTWALHPQIMLRLMGKVANRTLRDMP